MNNVKFLIKFLFESENPSIVSNTLETMNLEKDENISDSEKLTRLSELKNFPERLDYATKNFGILSDQVTDGTARQIFNFSENKVLKVAKNPEGMRQNYNEIRVNNRFPDIVNEYLTVIHQSDPEGKWIVTEKIKPFRSEGDFSSRTGLPFSLFSHFIREYGLNRFLRHGPNLSYDNFLKSYSEQVNLSSEDVSKIERNKDFILSLIKLIDNKLIGIGDLITPIAYAHFGTSVETDKMKLYDYGHNPNRIEGLEPTTPQAAQIEKDLENAETSLIAARNSGILPSIDIRGRPISSRELPTSSGEKPSNVPTRTAVPVAPMSVRNEPLRGNLFRPLSPEERARNNR